MFRIGEFSRLAHVSCRLLRHYETCGLLRPAATDSDTGYRYYATSQLVRLNRILVLRDLGFSLEQIGRLIEEAEPAALRAMLVERRASVERELQVQAARLRQLEQRIQDLENSPDAALGDVLFRAIPTTDMVSVRLQGLPFAEVRRFAMLALSEVPRQLGRRQVGRLFAVQHAEEFEPEAMDMDVGFTTERPLDPQTTIVVDGRSLRPGVLPELPLAAVCVRVGPPEEVHPQSRAIARQVEARGLRLAGPNREVFLKSPTADQPPVIEVQFPVMSAEGRTPPVSDNP